MTDLSMRNAPVQNWMKNVTFSPSVFVEPTSVEELQAIVKDKLAYPSPIRPAGKILSPTAIHLNDGGTTVKMTNLNKIHGLKEIALPSGRQEGEKRPSSVICIDTDCGVTLRELEIYAHQNGMELPFSAEIGSATIGGTAFAITKDSAIGSSPVPGMGIGDVGSCIFAFTLLQEGGELKEYRVIDEATNEFDPNFQGLLDSYGTQGIGVRFLVTLRAKTAFTTTLHFWENKTGNEDALAKNLLSLWRNAASLNGNLFALLGVGSPLVMLEERIPIENNKWKFAPLSFLLAPLYTNLLRFLIQRCLLPSVFLSLRFLSGTCMVRFARSSRAPGNHYKLDVPTTTRKLTFSYYAFPIDDFQKVVSEGLRFVHDYKRKHGFAPVGFAIYFVSPNGKRLAGPYGGVEGSQTGTSFSFDPFHKDPNDPEWDAFIDAFNAFAKSRGGRVALNQTLGLEKDLAYGSQALHGEPSSRFTSPWFKRFFDARF